MARISGNEMCYANNQVFNRGPVVSADATNVAGVQQQNRAGQASAQNAIGQQNQLSQIVDGPEGARRNSDAEFPEFMTKREGKAGESRQAGTPESRQANFKKVFGDDSYVKDLADPALLELLSNVGEICPETAQKAQNGKLTKDDIAKLQTKLEQKGFSVGKCGADGKFGKDTFSAVGEFLKKKTEAQSKGVPVESLLTA